MVFVGVATLAFVKARFLIRDGDQRSEMEIRIFPDLIITYFFSPVILRLAYNFAAATT